MDDLSNQPDSGNAEQELQALLALQGIDPVGPKSTEKLSWTRIGILFLIVAALNNPMTDGILGSLPYLEGAWRRTTLKLVILLILIVVFTRMK